MSYDVKILADSIASGVRLVSLAATYPRIIHSEVMTHRVFSRNAASSRAIPVSKNIERVLADPFVPEAFAANVKGMQGGDMFAPTEQNRARDAWMNACSSAMHYAELLADQGVHKHWANRLLEPYSWITTVITATEWENFFALRCHKDAAPEFQKIAGMIREAMQASEPQELAPGGWHLPFHQPEDRDFAEGPLENSYGPEGKIYDAAGWGVLVKLSVARCARVSYLTHDGRRDVDADLALYAKLTSASLPHLSPCEHAARAAADNDEVLWRGDQPDFVGNFRWPWIQHRQDLEAAKRRQGAESAAR